MAHKGQRFTHKHFMDPNWKPGPGEAYKDAPKAEMVVTRVSLGSVHYDYADGTGKSGWHMPEYIFDGRYPED